MKTLQKDPSLRDATISEFRQDFEKLLQTAAPDYIRDPVARQAIPTQNREDGK